MFAGNKTTWPLPFRVMKAVCGVLLAVYLVIGLISAYRAWYQVHSLDLRLTGFGQVFIPNDPRQSSVVSVRSGSTIETTLVSYARTTIDVRVELIQGGHAEVLMQQTVRGNEWGFFDPRTRRASQSTVLTDVLLSRFERGRALVRATAVGREQWTRLPPPVIQESAVEISKD
jgi:hypothetical protein